MCGLGNSLSDTSKELIWRGGGWRGVCQYICGFVEGRYMYRHTFWQKVTASNECGCQLGGTDASINDFSAVLDMRRCRKLGL